MTTLLYTAGGFLAGFLLAMLIVIVMNRRAENVSFRRYWFP